MGSYGDDCDSIDTQVENQPMAWTPPEPNREINLRYQHIYVLFQIENPRHLSKSRPIPVRVSWDTRRPRLPRVDRIVLPTPASCAAPVSSTYSGHHGASVR